MIRILWISLSLFIFAKIAVLVGIGNLYRTYTNEKTMVVHAQPSKQARIYGIRYLEELEKFTHCEYKIVSYDPIILETEEDKIKVLPESWRMVCS